MRKQLSSRVSPASAKRQTKRQPPPSSNTQPAVPMQPAHGEHNIAHFSILPPPLPEHTLPTTEPGIIQRKPATLDKTPSHTVMHQVAQQAIRSPTHALPYAARIQQAFGHHDVSNIQAHQGEEATASARAMQAHAFASSNHIVFAATPDLHTTAHEAAHVIQQSHGRVRLEHDIGKVGDLYEQQADAVADRVVAGKSAETLLDRSVQGQTYGIRENVQRIPEPQPEPQSETSADGNGLWIDKGYNPPLYLNLETGGHQQGYLGVLPFQWEGKPLDYLVAQNIYLDRRTGAPVSFPENQFLGQATTSNQMEIATSSSGNVFIDDSSSAKNKVLPQAVNRLKSLLKEDEFYKFALADKRTFIEIGPKKLEGLLKGETYLFAEVDDEYHNVDDPEDTLFRTFSGWSKVNKNTRFKVVIYIAKKIAATLNIDLLITLIHEYAVHAVEYRKFIELVRRSENFYSEIALSYFRHSDFAGGYLNATQQHNVHAKPPEPAEGSDQPSSSKRRKVTVSVEENAKNLSGSVTFNKIIQNLLKNSNEEDKKKIFGTAANDVAKAGKKEANETIESGGQPVKSLRTAEGSVDRILQQIAIFFAEKSTQEERVGAGASLLSTIENQGGMDSWKWLLSFYLNYFVAMHGNALGLKPADLASNLDTIKNDQAVQQALPAAQQLVLLAPMPRTPSEALIEYLVLGGYQYSDKEAKETAYELVELLNKHHNWNIIWYYVRYRYYLEIALGRHAQAQLWLFFQQDLSKLRSTSAEVIFILKRAIANVHERADSHFANYIGKLAFPLSLGRILDEIGQSVERRNQSYEQEAHK